jgi:hypothetical protein
MAFQGINFRTTSGFVTDGGTDTYSLGEAYPITRGGVTFGWDTDITANTRDRGGTSDVRLAGLNFHANGGGVSIFRIDLPLGTGTYDIKAAFGDTGGSEVQNFVFKDGGSAFKTVTGIATAVGFFTDANGSATMSDTAWVGSNVAITHTFTSSIFTIEVGGAGTNVTTINHVEWNQTAGGGGGGLKTRKLLLGVGA